MKISMLKKLIKEAVREAVREEMVLLEQRVAKPGKNVVAQEQSGLNELRAKFKQAQASSAGDQYSDLEHARPVDAPANPRTLLKQGEVFASGKGIMEWFQGQKQEAAVADVEAAKKKMQKTGKYIERVFGQKL